MAPYRSDEYSDGQFLAMANVISTMSLFTILEHMMYLLYNYFSFPFFVLVSNHVITRIIEGLEGLLVT